MPLSKVMQYQYGNCCRFNQFSFYLVCFRRKRFGAFSIIAKDMAAF
jgi:hypothetical protein